MDINFNFAKITMIDCPHLRLTEKLYRVSAVAGIYRGGGNSSQEYK